MRITHAIYVYGVSRGVGIVLGRMNIIQKKIMTSSEHPKTASN